jgi:GcrA cell cycle regulator
VTAWTDEQIAEVKRLWTIGHSAKQISIRVGKSRNAVIGIIHRKGFNGRQPAPRVTKPRAPKRQSPAALIVRPATTPRPERRTKPIEAPPQPRSDKPGLLQLRSTDCKWTYGDPLQPGFHFCGAPQVLASPYCAAHQRISVAPKEMTPARPGKVAA